MTFEYSVLEEGSFYMNVPLYYDRQGNPISADKMVELFSDLEARLVARDELEDIVLSTVHLVIDHNYSGRGKPIIFESMIFGGPRDGDMRRYATEAEALEGHAALLAELKLSEGVTLAEIELELAGLLP